VHQFTDKGQDVRASEFHVGLFNQSQKPSRQAKFLREELIVSDAGKGMARVVDVRAIVVIPAGALGDLLGDAENPAHTTWDPKRDRMSKWQFGGPWITFVRQSPKKILEAARGINRDIDRTIAADWFPDLSSSGSYRTSGKDQGRIRTPEVPPIPPPREPIIKFSQISGGFVAVLAPTAPPISTVDISFAYDRQRGNPLKNWSPDDFVLEDLEITLTGGTRVAAEAERDSNHVTIAVTHQSTFRLEVRGFDKNRDVIAEGRYA
jgi:hypothetical protein